MLQDTGDIVAQAVAEVVDELHRPTRLARLPARKQRDAMPHAAGRRRLQRRARQLRQDSADCSASRGRELSGGLEDIGVEFECCPHALRITHLTPSRNSARAEQDA